MLGGFFGGRVDDVVMFVVTCRLSIPIILVRSRWSSLRGSSLELVILTLGLLLWDRFAVVSRTTTMQVRNLDYVAAAWSAGASRAHILLARGAAQHPAAPHRGGDARDGDSRSCSRPPLSFLGLGVPPPLPSWGLMIAEGKDYMFFSPWVIMVPGVALFVLVLGINLLGDGLRDRLARIARRDDGRCSRSRTSRVGFGAGSRRCAASRSPIERGETHCLVGESGCGKSVTSLAIMGLLRAARAPHAAHIRFARHRSARASPSATWRGCAATGWR